MASDRSDLRTAVAMALLSSEMLGDAVVEVIEVEGAVTLEGRVTSEQDRLLAQDLASSQAGVVELINNIIVLE